MIISLKAALWPLTPPVAKSSLALPSETSHSYSRLHVLFFSHLRFHPSIALHLLLTFTLCLLQISSWVFFHVSHWTSSEKMHTKQRLNMSYELLECFSVCHPEMHSYSFPSCCVISCVCVFYYDDRLDWWTDTKQHTACADICDHSV